MTKIIFSMIFSSFTTLALAGEPVLKQIFIRDSGSRVVPYSETSNARLSTLINIDDYLPLDRICVDSTCELSNKNAPAPHNLCIAGDISKVCSLLSRMYQTDKKEYEAGDHEFTKLLACQVVRGQKKVFMRIETIQDFENIEINAEHTLLPCDSIEQ